MEKGNSYPSLRHDNIIFQIKSRECTQGANKDMRSAIEGDRKPRPLSSQLYKGETCLFLKTPYTLSSATQI